MLRRITLPEMKPGQIGIIVKFGGNSYGVGKLVLRSSHYLVILGEGLSAFDSWTLPSEPEITAKWSNIVIDILPDETIDTILKFIHEVKEVCESG